MAQSLLTIRLARPHDAEAVASVHDLSWRDAYRGIIPGRELERMVERRGPAWWETAISRGSRVAVLDFDDRIGGYVTFGVNRLSASPYQGEIFELYLLPEFQGLGFGRRLFQAARKDLNARRLDGLMVWSLAANERACVFYEKLGGRKVRRMIERFGDVPLERVGFGWA